MDGTCLDYLRVSTETSENWRKKDIGGRREADTEEEEGISELGQV